MAQINDNPEQGFRDRIKRIWHTLSDEEISFHETMRDMFFLAVRKKYGLPRAQAEDVLRSLTHAPRKDAA